MRGWPWGHAVRRFWLQSEAGTVASPCLYSAKTKFNVFLFEDGWRDAAPAKDPSAGGGGEGSAPCPLPRWALGPVGSGPVGSGPVGSGPVGSGPERLELDSPAVSMF